nr:terpene cyclase/mutase family protein [candidate division Zixibacteria bacterium]
MAKELREIWELIPIEWLLGREAFVKYRTMTDLLGRNENDREVLETKNSIIRCKPIRRILERQNTDEYWGKPNDIYSWWPKKDTTFWILGVLGDFGLDRDHPQIAAACEYVFRTQLPGGGFGWAPPPTPADCFTGILTESLAKLGYVSDPRSQKAYAWLLNRQRLDGGFWCKNTGLPGGSREREPSCAFATLCVMGAFARNPDLADGESVRRGLKFLLKCWENRGKIKYAGHDSEIGRGWEKLKYPYTDYRILKYLEVLSQFELIRNDPNVHEMIDLLLGKGDTSGRYFAESIHKAWSDFDFGQKRIPSRWITFLMYRIIKRFIT